MSVLRPARRLPVAVKPRAAEPGIKLPTTSEIAFRGLIVGLTLATGYIHFTLGGWLFTMNAAGYAVAAVAMVIPLPLAIRYRSVVRLGLIGYAAATIIGWWLTGPRYETAYIAKAIEVGLIVLLSIDLLRHHEKPQENR
jgi:hypothetical protein